MRKEFIIFFCLAVVICLNPICVQAYSGGTGSSNDPYQISNVTDLKSMSTQANLTASNGKYYLLTTDINLQGETFTPIGQSLQKAFMGHFDGGGHTISNLSITGTGSYIALFGYIRGNATIENVQLTNCTITANGKSYIGGVCAYAYQGTIQNVSFSGSVTGGSYTGAICGFAMYSTLQFCVATGSVKGSLKVGGICGYAKENSHIMGCCNLANVEATSNTAGGICGEFGYQQSSFVFSTLTDCSNFGNIKERQTNNNVKSGGIVGKINTYSLLNRCFSVCSGSQCNIGAIVGCGSNNNPFTDLYYDTQICTNISSSATIGDPQGLSTSQLTNGKLFDSDNWSEVPGRYPIPTGLINSPMAKVAAAAIVLADSDDVTSVSQFVNLSKSNGETWTRTSGSSLTLVDGCIAYPNAASGTSTLSASITSGGTTYTKAIGLTATATCTPTQFTSGSWQPTNNSSVIIAGNANIGDGNNPSEYTIENLYIGTAGELTISPSTTLIINGILSCDDPTKLILEDGAQIIHNNSGVKATLQSDIEGYGSNNGVADGWYFVSSPIFENANVSTLIPQSGNYDLYRFNEEESLWENVKSHASDFSTLNNGEGYLYANSIGQDISFAGTLFASYADIPLTKENSGWNLVGNPFPCDATVNKTYYICNGSSIILGSGSIGRGEGIMVKTETGNDSIRFTKVIPNQQSSQTPSCIFIEVSPAIRGAKLMDNAAINLGSGSQIEKFYFNDNSCLYIPQGKKEYAMLDVNNQGTLPLCFVAPKDGEYTLSFNAKDIEMDYIHLIDNITSIDVDLLSIDDYTFTAKTNDYESRFKLVFRAASEIEEKDADFAFFSDGELIIINEGKATLQIIDMAGRIVRSKVIDGDYRLGTQDLSSGVYVLNLDGKAQKVIL